MHTARAQGCKSQWLCDKHNCPQSDSIPGPRTLQSHMLPLDHCDLPDNDIRHVRIWIGHHYCMSMLACQYKQPKQPGDLDLSNLKVVFESRVTYVGYLCVNFGLLRPLCYQLRPDVRDRQTSDKSISLNAPTY